MMRRAPQSINTFFSASLLLPLTAAITLNCEAIQIDGAHFNLKPLGGAHAVSQLTRTPNSINSTFTLDICKPLEPPSDVPKDERCPTGTYVCGIQYVLDEEGVPEDKPLGVIPIAGQYTTSTGATLNPKFTRLKTSPSHADSQQEGVRIEIGGGKYKGWKQKAVIEFICMKGGTEKREEGDHKDNKSQDEVDDGQGGTLKFLSYERTTDQEETVLRLSWRTKYACEDAEESSGSRSGGWGFFSWFFFLLFLGFLAYLIFGAWLNYNRYGARGWDLLPHGDMIRDVPYILQDWFRKVVDTLQGGHSRGAYSAI